MIDLQKVAAHYGGTGSGNQCSIPTPGHSKRDLGTSITIKSGAPDGLLVKCHNGSDEDALAVKDMLRRDGFLPPRETPNGENDNASWRQRASAPSSPAGEHAVELRSGQRIVASYRYEDHDGKLLYRKHRIEPGDGERNKTFRADRPDGNGGWLPGAGIDRVPYRLPHLAAAPKSEPLIMAEGERKADKLADWGFLATSHKDWQSFQFSGYVKGRTVFILPDNDDAGAAQAARAKEAVETAGGTAHIVDLPGLPSGGDIMDWDGTAEALQKLADRAAEGADRLLPALDLVELAKTKAEPRRFVIQRIAPASEVTLFTGAGSAGKSLLSQQLATCSAGALGSCLGLDVQPGPAIYITCEDSSGQLHWIHEHICKRYNLAVDELAHQLHLVSLRGELDNALGTFDARGILKPSTMFERLALTIEHTGAHLVFLDNVGHLYTGNENDRGQVTQFVNLLNRLAERTGAAIILLGHPSKGSKPGEKGHEASGSTAWTNSVRSQFNIEHDLETDLRRLTLGKSNYAQKGAVAEFRWHDFAFWREDDLPADYAAELAQSIRASGDNEILRSCIRERNRQRRPLSEHPNAQNYAPKICAEMLESKGIGRKRLTAAMDRLFRIGAIERGFLWRDTSEGKDIFGIREMPESSPETTRKLHPETSGNPQKTTGNTLPIDKSIMGAACRPAAPDDDDDLDWSEPDEGD